MFCSGLDQILEQFASLPISSPSLIFQCQSKNSHYNLYFFLGSSCCCSLNFLLRHFRKFAAWRAILYSIIESHVCLAGIIYEYFVYTAMTQSKFAFRVFWLCLPPVLSSSHSLAHSLSLSLGICSVANAVAAAVAESYQKASANVADNESEMNSLQCE